VTLDTTGPQLTWSPAEHTGVFASSVTVTGTATDLYAGVAEVLVNGQPAALAGDGSFSVDVPLAEGVNTVTVTARDRVGNETSESRSVRSFRYATAWQVAGERGKGALQVFLRITDAGGQALQVDSATAQLIEAGGAVTVSAPMRWDADTLRYHANMGHVPSGSYRLRGLLVVEGWDVTVAGPTVERRSGYPGWVADGDLSDFDHTNTPDGSSFTAEAGAYRATSGPSGNVYARGVQPVPLAGEGAESWYGADLLLPAGFWQRATTWQNIPVRLVNWRQYGSAKDNAGTSFRIRSGGDQRLELATWRDTNLAGKRVHAVGPRLAEGRWYRLDVFQRFSPTAPLSELYLDGALVGRSTAPVYGWDRPFVLSDFQCGLVAVNGSYNLAVLVDNCYVGPARLEEGRR
jgi:hypothetical protein